MIESDHPKLLRARSPDGPGAVKGAGILHAGISEGGVGKYPCSRSFVNRPGLRDGCCPGLRGGQGPPLASVS